MKYRKKPVIVEATQWFKREYDLESGMVHFYAKPGVPSDRICKHCGHFMQAHGWIDTLEGGHIVCPGDWIITGVEGEHYPVKDGIFGATYELVRGTRNDRSLPRRQLRNDAADKLRLDWLAYALLHKRAIVSLEEEDCWIMLGKRDGSDRERELATGKDLRTALDAAMALWPLEGVK